MPDVAMQASVLLLKIHVITGWEIPQQELMTILADQFVKKILESYPSVTPEEVEYAFRNKPIELKEWGKSMNISLIDEVMVPYLEKRFEISRIEEQRKQIEHKPSKEQLEQIDREYEAFLKTDLGKKLTENGLQSDQTGV